MQVVIIHVHRVKSKDLEVARSQEVLAEKLAADQLKPTGGEDKDPENVIYHHFHIDSGMTWSDLDKLITESINPIKRDRLITHYAIGLDQTPIYKERVKRTLELKLYSMEC